MSRPESTTVRLTPSQMARLRAAGWEPGAGPLDEWLVRRAERARIPGAVVLSIMEVMKTARRGLAIAKDAARGTPQQQYAYRQARLMEWTLDDIEKWLDGDDG